MAVSGSQLTRIGTGKAVGRKITITAKDAADAVANTIIEQSRAISRFVSTRIFGRVN